jgi:hypothetical protein
MRCGRLHGRERELAVLHDLAHRLAGSTGGALVVRGEAGIGKSSLLAAIIEQVQERGVQGSGRACPSPASISFCDRSFTWLEGCPLANAPRCWRRSACPTRSLELFLVALATLELIGETAQGSPVLLVIEDAQWLDQPK